MRFALKWIGGVLPHLKKGPLTERGFGNPEFSATGCVPWSPTLGKRERGSQVCGLDAVVGIHLRIEGWGLRTGELPHLPPAAVDSWQWQRLRGTVPGGT